MRAQLSGRGARPGGLHGHQAIRTGSWGSLAGAEAPAVPQSVRWQWWEVKG